MQLWGCSNCVCVLAGWNRGGGEGGAGRRQRAQPAEHPRCHHGEFLPGEAGLEHPWERSRMQNGFFFLMSSPPPRPYRCKLSFVVWRVVVKCVLLISRRIWMIPSCLENWDYSLVCSNHNSGRSRTRLGPCCPGFYMFDGLLIKFGFI